MTSAVLAKNKSTLLRSTLKVNAIFSLLSGLELLVFNRPISQFLGWSNTWIIALIGLGLLAFAGVVWQVAKSPKSKSNSVKTIIAADISWVILSIILIALPTVLSFEGKWATGILADIVAVFAILQIFGLRQTRNQS